MRVAILNISIGKYDVFWKEFYQTCETNFLPECEKFYYVFTDNIHLYGKDNKNVRVIFQKDMGWPFNTMKRFSLFEQISEELLAFEYVFFINGNARFVQPLSRAFINQEKNIITVQHPGLCKLKQDDMPFERNSFSKAYIPKGKGRFYVQGAFIGGKSEAFAEMVKTLNRLTEEDLKNGIIAVWHDESFLNKYILDRKDVQVLGRQYLSYEEYVFPYKPVIMLRNKRRENDLNKIRGMERKEKKNHRLKLKLYLRNRKESMLIKIGIETYLVYKDSEGNYVDNDIDR